MTMTAFLRLAPLLLALAIAAGCGKKDEAKSVSQVAAKVNADEITVYQVNNLLSRTPNLTPESAVRAKTEILEKLIDQQLARQQAITMELDRTPAVVQAIEAARSEILARAYLEKMAATLPKPTAEEVKQYYAAHPELFAQRHIYNLEEIGIEPKESLAAELREQVAKAHSMGDIATWLKSQDMKFSVNRGVRPAEALPLELLPKLQILKDGEMQLVDTGGGRQSVFRVVASQLVPVDEVTATPRIQQFLFNQNASKAIAAQMKALRDRADIAYLGEFVGGAAAAEAKAKELAKEKTEVDTHAQVRTTKMPDEAEVGADASAKTKAAVDATGQETEAKTNVNVVPSKPAQLRQENVERGLGGLK